MNAGSLENILAIESSGPKLSVALARREQPGSQIKVLQARVGIDENRHAEELPELVDSLLHAEGLTPGDVTSVVLGDGPGSFTGLRIGFSFAQGWCWSGTALRVLSTYTALGYYTFTRFPQFQYVIVAGDARRDELFCAVYKRLNSGFGSEIAFDIQRPQEVVRIIERAGTPLNHVVVVARTACETTSVLIQSFGPQLGFTLGGLELGEAQALCEYSVVAEAPTFSSVAEVSAAVPCYMRAVAARKISERT